MPACRFAKVQNCQKIIEEKGGKSQYWPLEKLVDETWDADLKHDMCSLLAPAILDAEDSEEEKAKKGKSGEDSFVLGVDLECAQDLLRAFMNMPYTPAAAAAKACPTEQKADAPAPAPDLCKVNAALEGKAEDIPGAADAADEAPAPAEAEDAAFGPSSCKLEAPGCLSSPTPCRSLKLEPKESERPKLNPAAAAAVSSDLIVIDSGSDADDAEVEKEIEPKEGMEPKGQGKAAEAEAAEDLDFDCEYFMRFKTDDLIWLSDYVKAGPHFQRFVAWMIAEHAVEDSFAEEWGMPGSDTAMELEDFSTFAKAVKLQWDPCEALSSSSAQPIAAEKQCPSQREVRGGSQLDKKKRTKWR